MSIRECFAKISLLDLKFCAWDFNSSTFSPIHNTAKSQLRFFANF